MLYDINTMKRWEVSEEYKKIILERHPKFKEKGASIVAHPSRIKMRMIVPSSDHNAKAQKQVVPPSPNSRKARGMITVNGDTLFLQYSSNPPRPDKNGVPRFKHPAATVVLSHNMKVRANDWDLMFYLEFLCPNIASNSCEQPSGTPFWKFDKPEVDAVERINEVKNRRKIEDLILFDSSKEAVVNAIVAVGAKDSGSEEKNRTFLFDKYRTLSDTLKTAVVSILESAKAQPKAEETGESVSELVSRLIEAKDLKFEDGLWYKRDKRSAELKYAGKPIFETSKTDESEAFFDFVEHLKVNTQLLDTLKK